MQERTHPNDIKCECNNCHEEDLFFQCPGCLQTVGYCLGQDDDYYEFCTYCWWQLSENLTTVVIQPRKFNLYING